jgi:hypothetical protein
VRTLNAAIRDRLKLVGAAGAVAAGLAIAGYFNHALGFGSNTFFLFLVTLTVFGLVVLYCATAWPQWYRRAEVRSRITLTFVVLLILHVIIVTAIAESLRFEWGMWIWAIFIFAEFACLVLILEGVAGRRMRQIDPLPKSSSAK